MGNRSVSHSRAFIAFALVGFLICRLSIAREDENFFDVWLSFGVIYLFLLSNHSWVEECSPVELVMELLLLTFI